MKLRFEPKIIGNILLVWTWFIGVASVAEPLNIKLCPEQPEELIVSPNVEKNLTFIPVADDAVGPESWTSGISVKDS